MMKLAVLAAAAGSAAAFAPASNGRAATSLAAEKSQAIPFLPAPTNCEGYVGNVGFDPLRVSDYFPVDYMREAELKHGRMCQLAWLGYVAVDLGIKFPGEKYAALSSFTAHEGTATYELFFLLLWVGTFETIGFSQIYGMCADGSDRQPGDFGFDPLGLLTPETDEQYRTAELIHGRLAMLAFSAVVTQSALPDAFGYGKSTFPYF